MIQIFKAGSSERLVLLAGFFILMHGPFLFWNDNPLVQEVLRMRLGERLMQGWRLYAQVSDETGPLPAMLYAFLAKFGLMNFRAQRVLAAILLWQQAIGFNQMARRHQLVSERNFLFAFFYIVLAHVSVDAVSLSPALIACSFLITTHGVLFRILKDGANPDDAMKMGLWLGLAFVSYQPAIIFIFPIFLAALLFSGMRVNHYLITAAATFLPCLSAYLFFQMSGGKSEFLHCFSAPFRLQPLSSLVSLQDLLMPALAMTAIAVLSWVYANQNSKVNFHRLGFNVFFFSALAGFLSIFFSSFRTGEGLLLLLLPTAGLMAQFVLHCRKRMLYEGPGILLMVIIMTGFYLNSGPDAKGGLSWNTLYMEKAPKGFSANFKGKSLLLLCDDFRYYEYNPVATRFFRHYLSNLNRKLSDTYEGLIFWHQCLSEDPPQLIYDPSGYIPELALHMPEFGRCYRMTFYPNLYEAIPGTTFGATRP